MTVSNPPAATERRRERRDRQRDAATRPSMQQITYNVPRYDLVNSAGIQRIHDESMRILRELGIDMYDAEVRDILQKHGAKVVGETVFFDEALVLKYVQMAPSQFTRRWWWRYV